LPRLQSPLVTRSNGESRFLGERKELTELIAERIKQLPDVPKRVLAMYYYEGMKLADIALAFGRTESRICQIHTQALSQLRTYVLGLLT
jgi:RNA polymerase sigma factor FliA